MTGLFWLLIGLFAVNAVFACVILLLRARNTLRARRLGRIEAKWEPVLIRVINGDDPPPPDVRGSEARHVLEIALRFARRLRGPDRQRIVTYVAPINRAARHELVSRSEGTRAAAVELYGVLAYSEYKEFISDALDDPSAEVSFVAARSLCQPDRTEFIDRVLEHLPRYAHWSQSLLAQMLASVGVGAVAPLRRYLASPRNPAGSRATAAAALRILRDPESVAVAEAALRSPDPELVVSALRLIRDLGSASSAGAIRPLLGHRVFFVRSEAATALGRIGDPGDSQRIIELLVAGDSPWVAIRSAQALAHLGDWDSLARIARRDDLAGDAAREVLERKRAA